MDKCLKPGSSYSSDSSPESAERVHWCLPSKAGGVERRGGGCGGAAGHRQEDVMKSKEGLGEAGGHREYRDGKEGKDNLSLKPACDGI